MAYPDFLLVLTVGECDVAQLKVPLAVLQTATHGRGRVPLPQEPLTEHQVMDVATISHTSLCRHCSHDQRKA